MKFKREIKKEIKEKLEEAVILWAEDNLIGKPKILANTMYFALESAMIKKIEEINKKF